MEVNHKIGKWNRERVLKEYKKLAIELGYPPNEKELRKRNHSLYKAMLYYFDSFNSAREKSGFEVNPAHGLARSIKDSTKNETEELGYIVGVVIGDGSVINSKKIVLETSDKEFSSRFSEFLEEWSGLKPRIYRKEGKKKEFPNGMECETKEKFVVVLNSTEACETLEKRLDNLNWIYNSTESVKKEILRGLWDSEGSVGDGFLMFYNSDKEIVNLYKYLMRELLGVRSFREKERNTGYKIGTRGGYKVMVDYIDKIGITIKRKINPYKKKIEKFRQTKKAYEEAMEMKERGKTVSEIEEYTLSKYNLWSHQWFRGDKPTLVN